MQHSPTYCGLKKMCEGERIIVVERRINTPVHNFKLVSVWEVVIEMEHKMKVSNTYN